MIKNLPLQLNEAGKIKIGMKGETITSAQGKEFRPPQKLDHFILTTTEKDDAGDYVIDRALIDRIKESGTGLVNDDGNMVGIPVRLLYENIEMNFPTRYACYAGRKLSCYGDGEKAFRRIDDYKKEYPCPCKRLDPDYEGDQKCKPNGRLICMIDEAGLFGQVHVFRTTSINSVKGIWGGMELIKVATKGRLAGVPLMLTLTARHTDKGVVYVVSICFNGTMEDLRDSVHALAVKEQVYLLDIPKSNAVVDPGSEDEQDFVEEFYPDAVANEGRAQSHYQAYQSPEQDQEVAGNVHDGPDSVDKNNCASAPRETCSEPGRDGSQLQTNGQKEHDKQTGGEHHDGITGETQAEKTKSEQESKETISQGTQAQDSNSNTADSSSHGVKPNSETNIESRLLKTQGQYASLYNRFIVALGQGDHDDAMKLAQRLTKDFLETFFTRERPDIRFKDPKPKKTDYLDRLTVMMSDQTPILLDRAPESQEEDGPEEHPFLAEIRAMTDRKQVAKAMVEFFKPIPVNLTLEREDLISWAEKRIGVDAENVGSAEKQNEDQAEKEIDVNDDLPTNPTAPGNTKEEPQEPEQNNATELFPYNPVSGPITDDQLRTIVKLKNKLEKKGLQQKEDWPGVIAGFATTEGETMATATAFCFDQGFELIERLNAKLPEDERETNVPF